MAGDLSRGLRFRLCRHLEEEDIKHILYLHFSGFIFPESILFHVHEL